MKNAKSGNGIRSANNLRIYVAYMTKQSKFHYVMIITLTTLNRFNGWLVLDATVRHATKKIWNYMGETFLLKKSN